MDVFWKVFSPILAAIISGLGCGFVSYLVSYGKLKGSVVLKNECKYNQNDCQKGVFASNRDLKSFVIESNRELKSFVIESNKELKSLIIELHDKQSQRMNEMDLKREKSIESKSDKDSKIATAIGRIEGQLGLLIKSGIGGLNEH